jgi:hypothetical protein
MASSSLHSTTLHLLKNRPRHITYEQIAESCQCMPGGITVGWLQQFITSRIKNPDVDRVQDLYEYLTDRPLSL